MLALFTTAERMILDWLVFWCGPTEGALHSPHLLHQSCLTCCLQPQSQRRSKALSEACGVAGVVQGAAVL